MGQKLNKKDVKKIRNMYWKEGKTQKEISNYYNINQATVSYFMKRKKINEGIDIERGRRISKKLTGRKITQKTKDELSKTRKKLIKEGKIEVWNKNKKGLQVCWNKGGKSYWLKKRNLENNPMKNLKTRKEHSIYLKEFYRINPEKHPNRILARNGGISIPQKQLFKLIKKYYPSAELNYRVVTKNSQRHADVGIEDVNYHHLSKVASCFSDHDLLIE
jgi:hypothetical protein